MKLWIKSTAYFGLIFFGFIIGVQLARLNQEEIKPCNGIEENKNVKKCYIEED